MFRLSIFVLFLTLMLGGAAMAEGRYRVQKEDFKGHAVYVLTDAATGQEARILPSVGDNCISYKIRKGDGQIELLWTPPDPETLQGRPSGYGIPLLFPWPNRIDHGKFTFDGKTYQLNTPKPGDHASHGFVLVRPWQVAGSGASDGDGAWVKSTFQSADFPEIGKQFPFPFAATVVYRLKDGMLQCEFEGTNAGTGEMPVGLGMHPYFALPLTKDGNRDVCTVEMPASKYWPLRSDPIPTGEILPVDGTIYDVRTPTPLKGRFYDNVWTGVKLTDGWSRCTYVDPTAGVQVSMEADDAFRELVLYAPESRPVVCFEPYTCTTNAFNIENQGIDAGMIRLKPGEKLRGVMRIVGEVLK